MTKGACIITTGRYGDHLNILPLARRLFEETKSKTLVTCGRQFADLYDGTSYAQPLIIGDDYRNYGNAIRAARRARPVQILDCAVDGINGLNYQIKTESFCAEAYSRAGVLDGFRRGRYDRIDIDQRDYGREGAIAGGERDPRMTLMNLAGHSSPFKNDAFASEILKAAPVCRRLREDFRAPRVFDLLGMYDRAGLLITTDTSTLHLAGASTIPYVALLADRAAQRGDTPIPWRSSYTRGNCVARIAYADAMAWLPYLEPMIEAVTTGKREGERVLDLCYMPPASGGDSRRRDHAALTTRRYTYARYKWSPFRVDDSMLPRLFVDAPDRRLPHVKDIIDRGIAECAERGIKLLAFSNTDTCHSPMIAEIAARAAKAGCGWGGRRDFERLTYSLTPEQIATGREYPGTDIFFFTPGWWREHRHEFPDGLLLGAEAWDAVMRELMRRRGGADLGNHHIAHERHGSTWEHRGNRYTLPSQIHCLKIAHAALTQLGVDPLTCGVRMP